MASGNPQRRRRKALMTGIATNVLVLGVVSLLTDVSSEMIYPILPLFLTAIGASGLVIGLIEGASETTAALVKVFSGWYSDKLPRRKPFITGGYSLSTITKPILAIATAPIQVLGIRITERVGKGIRSAPRDALIADSTAQEFRGKAYGLHKAFDSTGAVIGPLLVIPVLLAASSITAGTYRFVFLLSTIPALVAVIVLLLFVREKPVTRAGQTGAFLKDIGRLGRPFYMLMAVVLTFYVGEISYAFMVLRAYEEGIGTINTILLYVLYNALFVLVAFPAGILSDSRGRKPVIIGSFLIFAGAAAVMAIADSWWILAISFAMFGIYKGTSEGVFKAFVTDVVPSNLRGTALGAFHTSVGLVMLPGGIIAGYLWDNVGHWATFAYGFLTAIVAIVLLLAVRTSKKVTPDEQPERPA
jgi:MFS family permease